MGHAVMIKNVQLMKREIFGKRLWASFLPRVAQQYCDKTYENLWNNLGIFLENELLLPKVYEMLTPPILQFLYFSMSYSR